MATVSSPIAYKSGKQARKPRQATPGDTAPFAEEPTAPAQDAAQEMTDSFTSPFPQPGEEEQEFTVYDARAARRVLREKEAQGKKHFLLLLSITLLLAAWAFQLYTA